MCESSSMFGLSSQEGCCSNVWAVSEPKSKIVYLLRISAFTCATRSRVPVLAMFKIRVGHVLHREHQDLFQTRPEWHVLNLFWGFSRKPFPGIVSDSSGGKAPSPRANLLSSHINETAQDPEPKRLCTQLFRLSPDIAQNESSNAVAQDLAQLSQSNRR